MKASTPSTISLRQISQELQQAADELGRLGQNVATATPLGREARHDAALADVCDAAGLALRKFAIAVAEDAANLAQVDDIFSPESPSDA